MINRRWDDVVTITVWLAFLLVAAGMIAGGFLTVRPRAPLPAVQRGLLAHGPVYPQIGHRALENGLYRNATREG